MVSPPVRRRCGGCCVFYTLVQAIAEQVAALVIPYFTDDATLVPTIKKPCGQKTFCLLSAGLAVATA